MYTTPEPYFLRLIYNPYKRDCRMTIVDGDTDKELSSDNTKVCKFLEKDPSLHHKIQELCSVLKGYASANTAGADVYFEGLRSDYDYVKSYVEDHDFGSHLCIKRGEAELAPASEAMNAILNQYALLETAFEEGKNEEATKAIDAFKSAKNPTVSICVAGTYSSGKSAFINALIGEEILPSEDSPTTARIYKISRCKNEAEPATISFYYNQEPLTFSFFGDDNYKCDSLSESGDVQRKWAELMCELKGSSRAQRVYQSIKTFNDMANSDPDCKISELLEVKVPFVRSNLPVDKCDFEIFDTPGSNAAGHEEHLKTLRDLLQKMTNGLPVVVTTNITSGATDAKAVVDELRTLGGNLDLGNALVVVNQADGSTMDSLKKAFPIDVRMSRLFFASSIMGLGSKKEQPGEFVDDKYQMVFSQNENMFTSPANKFYKQLFRCNRLPGDATAKELEEFGIKATASGADERTLLLHNSGLWAIEHEIGAYAEEFALYNKCRTARDYLEKAIVATKEQLDEITAKQEQEKNQLFDELDNGKQSLIRTLEEETAAYQEKCGKGYVDLQSQVEKAWRSDMDEELKTLLRSLEKTVKKKKEGGHRKNVNSEIDNFIEKWTNNFKDRVDQKAADYWGGEENGFKEMCIAEVIKQDELTQEEKDFFSQFILSMETPSLKRATEASNAKLVKDKKFLWIKIGEKFDSKSGESFVKTSIEDVMGKYSIADQKKRNQQFNTWSNDICTQLVSKAAEWNPNLKEMKTNLEYATQRLNTLNDQLDKARIAEGIIAEVLAFRPVIKERQSNER